MNYVTVNNVSDMKAGYYLFSPADNVKTIVKSLRQGGAAYPLNGKDTITIREGENVEAIATEVGEKTSFSKDDFLKAVNDEAFFNRLKEAYPGLLDSESSSKMTSQIRYKLEGYLYPATYDFKDVKTVNELINQMVYQSYVTYKPLFEDINKSGMTLHQILTVASLVEGEAADETNRGKIAGVFLNRIAINMPLQSDVTVKYALDTNKANLTNDDVKVDSPYNLYANSGYGPGPFNNPTVDSVKAVLHPIDRDKGYLYFVANLKTGKNYYSKTYDEHLGNQSSVDSTNQTVK
jgi:UPF0755 protein